MGGMCACSSWRSWCISLSATLRSVRSSGEATPSRRRRKPPSPPAVTSEDHLVLTVVGLAVGGFPPAMLAAFGVFAEAVVLAKVMSVSWLLLATVRWTEERGLLLMGTGPLVVLSVAEVSEGVKCLMVPASEKL